MKKTSKNENKYTNPTESGQRSIKASMTDFMMSNQVLLRSLQVGSEGNRPSQLLSPHAQPELVSNDTVGVFI